MLPKGFKAPAFERDHNAQCVLLALNMLKRSLTTGGYRRIVIDRPHTQLWEMKAAVVMAQKYGWNVAIHETATPWAKQWKACAERTRSKVSPALLSRMAAEYEPGTTVEEILESETPLAKLERCEELWNRMRRETGAARQATWDLIRSKYEKQLSLLITEHGLLGGAVYADGRFPLTADQLFQPSRN